MPAVPAVPTAAVAPALRLPGQPRSPDLLCVGAQKAGTTWLHTVLAHHPGFWLPPFKEIDYFTDPGANLSWKFQAMHHQMSLQVKAGKIDLPTMRWWSELCLAERMDVAWYRRLFAPAGARVTGEVSPNYTGLSPAQAARAREVCPDAKIIVMLRDPIDRVWSMARMMHRAGRLSALDGPALEACVLAPEAVAWSDYWRLLATWEGAFGPDRVLVLFYEELERSPLAVVERICGFFGVPFRPAAVASLAQQRFNDAPQAPLPPALAAALAQRLRAPTQALARRYPAEAGPYLERLLAALPRAPTAAPAPR